MMEACHPELVEGSASADSINKRTTSRWESAQKLLIFRHEYRAQCLRQCDIFAVVSAATRPRDQIENHVVRNRMFSGKKACLAKTDRGFRIVRGDMASPHVPGQGIAHLGS